MCTSSFSLISLPKPMALAEHSFFYLSIFLSFHLSFAKNFISVDQSLSGKQTISSTEGNFVLGFFQPGNNNSVQNFYIGIWYKNIPQHTPIWVANRESPVTNPRDSELTISSGGNLILLDQFKSLIWSTNVTSVSSDSIIAEILDSGNLILRDRSDLNRIFWQSCDHPSDTWLPGCRLGLNEVTGENIHLTSWKNLYDPAPGLFSLVVESNQFVLKRNDSMLYWTSEAYDAQSNSSFAGLSSIHFEYNSSSSANYFTYSSKQDDVVRIELGHSGQLQELVFNNGSTQWAQLWSVPENPCSVYAVCGPFGYCSDEGPALCSCPGGFHTASSWDWFIGDYSSGCVRDEQECSANDEFTEMPGVSAREHPQTVLVDDADGCELACLKNCSCTAFSYGDSCSVWYGDLLTLEFSYGYNGDILRLRSGASAAMQMDSGKKNADFVMLVLGAIFGSMVCFALIIFLIRRNVRVQKMTIVEGCLVAYRYNDLKQITRDFSEKLGGGAFGCVFKGLLPDSTVVAVKKLEGFLQGEKQFRSEVSTIGLIQHVNLVRLYGFCSEGNKKLLVYEYMPNLSLDFHLFQSTNALDWRTRYQIALGVARGLSYLHENCRDCIIHCDIKPENILLDSSFVPKVADFGLAKIVGRDFSRVLTTVRGTLGYLAPEWISGGSITAKADVYSYGMMLLEIISGRRNSEPMEDGGRASYFPFLACNKVIEGDVLNLLDGLESDVNLEELNRALKVACWCIQDNESCRPTMGLVVHILEGNLDVSTPPVPRVIQVVANNSESIV